MELLIKLVCESCGHIWYTANTQSNQKCSACGGNLVEVDIQQNQNKQDVKKTAQEN